MGMGGNENSIFSHLPPTGRCIVEFTGHLLSDEIREWEWEGMGTTNGNGNKTRLNLGSVMGIRTSHWEWD